MIPLIQSFDTVILANGAFPEHEIPLSILQKAKTIIACDGATESLLKYGLEPAHIVGDLDSLSDGIRKQYASRLNHDSDQETNDLTKAVYFSIRNGWRKICILGATGKREDHSLGNISLLSEYIDLADTCMCTDYGVFNPINKSTTFESFAGQQVSLFSLTPETLFSTDNLKYPLTNRSLTCWWQGTLNESLGDSFEIKMNNGKVIIFRTYLSSI